jgi:hypothetical protein
MEHFYNKIDNNELNINVNDNELNFNREIINFCKIT